MKLLILGGTQFIGRHLTEAALAAGHKVTLFNRNRHGAGLFPEVETLTGDRLGDLGALDGRTWDAVIDTSAYTPAVARRSAERLQHAVGHYTFVSTVSVYRDFAQLEMDETAPVGTITDRDVQAAHTAERAGESVGAEAYGPLKARCEEAVKAVFPGGALIVRPGLVVGPYDYTDRFTYWVRRVGLAGKSWGGGVLAPGRPEQRVQFIDARDLAMWLLAATEAGTTGTFNATGPDSTLTLGTLFETCRRVLNPEAELVWVDDAFLLERGLSAGDLMPWLPSEAMPGWEGFFSLDVRKAVAHGLTFRPLETTVRDTSSWDRARGDEPLRSGLTPERETALLNEWRTLQL
jgi:2'-hydroxyisoflavone reductase